MRLTGLAAHGRWQLLGPGEEPVSPAVAGVTRAVLTAPFCTHGERQQLLAEVKAEVQRTVTRKQVRPLTFPFLYPAPLPYSTLTRVRYGQSSFECLAFLLGNFFLEYDSSELVP